MANDLCVNIKVENEMKTQTKLLLVRIAGVVSILFTLFHAGFYWLFKWSETLMVLNANDRAILLTFNLISILLLLYSVILALGFARQLIETVAGKSILLFFTAFYLVRIYCEFAYFGFRMPSSIIIITICLVPAVCFGLPVVVKSK
jgi:hypothetical protein